MHIKKIFIRRDELMLMKKYLLEEIHVRRLIINFIDIWVYVLCKTKIWIQLQLVSKPNFLSNNLLDWIRVKSILKSWLFFSFFLASALWWIWRWRNNGFFTSKRGTSDMCWGIFTYNFFMMIFLLCWENRMKAPFC